MFLAPCPHLPHLQGSLCSSQAHPHVRSPQRSQLSDLEDRYGALGQGEGPERPKVKEAEHAGKGKKGGQRLHRAVPRQAQRNRHTCSQI